MQNYQEIDTDFTGNVYITLDIDWASDSVLNFSIDLLTELEIHKATFFVTHNTVALNTLREKGYELGIHPNFVPLIQGTDNNKPESILRALRAIVPESVSIRTHGLITSAYLSRLYQDLRFTHESNIFIPSTCGYFYPPFKFPNSLIQIVHGWGDGWQLNNAGLFNPFSDIDLAKTKVLLFHPIHLFLNSHTPNIYKAAKSNMNNYSVLKKLQDNSPQGTRMILKHIASQCKSAGLGFESLNSISVP